MILTVTGEKNASFYQSLILPMNSTFIFLRNTTPLHVIAESHTNFPEVQKAKALDLK